MRGVVRSHLLLFLVTEVLVGEVESVGEQARLELGKRAADVAVVIARR